MNDNFCYLNLVLSLIFLQIPQIHATEKKDPTNYRRSSIGDARYGSGSIQKLIKKSYSVAEYLDQRILGQKKATMAIQSRLIRYFENFGKHTREPIYVNMIGGSGVGKSDMIEKLKEMGFPVLQIDLQRFANQPDYFANHLKWAIQNYINAGSPLILALDEIDKVGEINSSTSHSNIHPESKTSSIIGTINEILSEGKLKGSGFSTTTPMSNVFVVTTMNYSPADFESFSQEALQTEKSYYDFTIEDFIHFESWVRNQASARYKVLARHFRSNTVTRMAPNTVIMEAFSLEVYHQIAELVEKKAIERMSQSQNGDRKIEVTFDPSITDFLVHQTAYAPSGAREMVNRSKSLLDELILAGIKAIDPSGQLTLDRPRHLYIQFDPAEMNAIIKITPQLWKSGNLSSGKSFEIKLKYYPEEFLFNWTQSSNLEKPKSLSKSTTIVKPVTKTEIHKARHGDSHNLASGLAEGIDSFIFGQEKISKRIEYEMKKYLQADEQQKKTPAFLALAGFTGVGKTNMVQITGEFTNLPIIKINLQSYASESSESVQNFIDTVSFSIEELKSKGQTKFILLLEELDKCHELNERGEPISRPIMGIIKDLLQDGYVERNVADNYGNKRFQSIDIRNAFTFVTMNFSVDHFNFSADPRLTSIEDIQKSFEKFSQRTTDIKKLMGSLFLPDTVNRIFKNLAMIPSLSRKAYESIIQQQIQNIEKEQFYDLLGRNIFQLSLITSDSYMKYLLSESVIPSEAGRFTTHTAKTLIHTTVQEAMKVIQSIKNLPSIPLIIKLDFNPEEQLIVSSLYSNQNTFPERILTQQKVELRLAPLSKKGKLSPTRIKVAAHEFGHAYAMSILGERIDFVSAVSLDHESRGFVKVANSDDSTMARNLIHSIYINLASRALERMVLSPTPKDRTSLTEISNGSVQDVQTATETIYNYIYKFGLNPYGGTIDRNGGEIQHNKFYAPFATLPHSIVTALSYIQNDLEQFILTDLLQKHTIQWYAKKVSELAQAGGMTELEFYQLIEHPLPEKRDSVLASNEHFVDLFGELMESHNEEEHPENSLKTREHHQKILQARQQYTDFFLSSIQTRLPSLTVEDKNHMNKGISCQQLFKTNSR